jgi:ParB-like chromosome segregation protein Spo0J
MQVETRPISSLVLDPANARKHGPKNLAAIKGSLARFGQQKPIIISDAGVVIAGNGTLTAAMELGWTEIDCVRTHLSGSDLTAFGIADNRTAELAEWDPENLGALLGALDEEFPLDQIGFDEADLAAMGIGIDEAPLPDLPDGDRLPFQQMAFHLHDSQVDLVDRALESAHELGDYDKDLNPNKSGNALARICAAYLKMRHG